MSIELCRCLARVVDLQFLQVNVRPKVAYNIELDTLYSESIISPGLDVVKGFFADVFGKKCTIPLYMELNFLGWDVKICVGEQFLWYYLQEIKRQDAVDGEYLTNWKSVKCIFKERYDRTNSLLHNSLFVDGHHIYFVSNLQTDRIIEVVFSCDERLFTEDRPWADLKASCQR
jgi:hypothetical protein